MDERVQRSERLHPIGNGDEKCEFYNVLRCFGIENSKQLASLMGISVSAGSTYWNHPECMSWSKNTNHKGSLNKLVAALEAHAFQSLQELDNPEACQSQLNKLHEWLKGILPSNSPTQCFTKDGKSIMRGLSQEMHRRRLLRFASLVLSEDGLSAVTLAVQDAVRKGKVEQDFDPDEVYAVTDTLASTEPLQEMAKCRIFKLSPTSPVRRAYECSE